MKDTALPVIEAQCCAAAEEKNTDGSCCSSVNSGSIESSLLSSISGKKGSLENNSTSCSGSFQSPPIDLVKPSGITEDFEDDKARMIAQLMENHAQVVTLSLVERSSLVQSIIRLSHHVPGCVIESLLEDISPDRRDKKERRADLRTHNKGQPNNSSSYLPRSRRKTTESCETSEEHKTYEGEQLSSTGMSKISGWSSAQNITPLPLSRRRQSALLFVDISGFTKLSTILDVESFSNCINKYFEKIISQIASFLKFAGDAMFCEWREASNESCQTLDQCVLQAALCASAIVVTCSDYSPSLNRRLSRRRSSLLSSVGSSFRSSTISISSVTGISDSSRSVVDEEGTPSKRGITLNVKCGIGVGNIVGLHVGDHMSRREFLIIGDPIDQVATAEAAANHGEVYASPEATTLLAKLGTLQGDWETNVNDRRPTCLAVHMERFFQPRDEFVPCRDIGLPFGVHALMQIFDDLNSSQLLWLKRMISLYVHPVVVSEESGTSSKVKHESDYERNVAAAELRNVFTCFISPKIDYTLFGDEEKDQKLFKLLNDIMTITTKHIERAQGQLRQFMVDDKGVVIILTFGLRGSTFPNMIAKRAIPLIWSICHSLQDELGVKAAAGATFEQAYCGVVGGICRHEFAVLGPAVNLAARLTSPKHNSGVILVDKNVRLLTSEVFFRPLPAVKAKGYPDPVPIFQPMKSTEQEAKWGHAKKNFVGRADEITQIMQVAKDMTLTAEIASKFLFVSAASGTGKSSLMVQATESCRAMVKRMKQKLIVTRYISNDGDSRIPFSLFRSIFKDLLRQVNHEDEASINSSNEGSNSSSRRGPTPKQASVQDTADFDVQNEWDSLSLQSNSTKSSIMSTDATRFRFICDELNAPPEFIEVVGRRLLGLNNSSAGSTGSKPPDLTKIVTFMADAFLRCTKNVDLVLLALDDVHWMDEMSWKVVQAIFERGRNVLVLVGSRPPSTNPLTVDATFWSDLHSTYKEKDRYIEISLGPFNEADVQEMISFQLDIKVDEIDSSFWKNVFTTSGGMPHYLKYVLETIRKNDLTVRLDNGLIGLKSSEDEDGKLGFKSVNELLLYRLDAIDASVRAALHLAAVLGTEFDLIDAALSCEEMFSVSEPDRFQSAMELCAQLDVAEKEGILEQVHVSTDHDQEVGSNDHVDEEDQLCLSFERLSVPPTGRNSHPLSSDRRRYRFTHDTWKTSILSVMLDERKEEMQEQVAIVLEREYGSKTESEDDLELQIRVFKHWNLSGNFPKAADLALKIGGQLVILGLNTQAILLFDDVLDVLKEISSFDADKKLGGISSSIIETIDVSRLEYLIKLNIAKGKACCNAGLGERARDAYQSALDILDYAPCASEKEFDRSISFPIFSGLFVVLKWGLFSKKNQEASRKTYVDNSYNKRVSTMTLCTMAVHSQCKERL